MIVGMAILTILDPDQPDAWFLELNSDTDSGIPNSVWETSFSNSVCNSVLCLKQSYPGVFPLKTSRVKDHHDYYQAFVAWSLILMVLHYIQLKKVLNIQAMLYSYASMTNFTNLMPLIMTKDVMRVGLLII